MTQAHRLHWLFIANAMVLITHQIDAAFWCRTKGLYGLVAFLRILALPSLAGGDRFRTSVDGA